MKYLSFLLFFASLALSATEIRLTKARVEFKGSVTLGEIAELTSEKSKLIKKLTDFQVVFDANGWLTKEDLKRQLETEFTGENFKLLGWNKVHKFECIAVDKDVFEQQVLDFLTDMSDGDVIRLKSVQLTESVVLPCVNASNLDFELVKKRVQHLFKKMRFSFVNTAERTLTLSFDIDVYHQGLTVVKAYKPGQIIERNDVVAHWSIVSSIRLNTASDLAVSNKFVALMPLTKGSVLNVKNVRPFGGVSEGQRITLFVHKNGIRLEAKAKALNSGKLNEVIQVIVQDQSEPVMAKVKGEGIAYVAL